MLTSLVGALLLAQAPSTVPPYLQKVEQPDGIIVMKTAAHRLTAPGKPDLWLVGVAHIGEKQYYSDIQGLLNSQDEVLFEGVRPKKADVIDMAPKGKEAGSLYDVLSKSFNLDFQLNDIDYRHANWINSDLSMEELDDINKKQSSGKPNGFNAIQQLMDPKSPTAKAMSSFFTAATPGMLEAVKVFFVEKLSTMDATSQFAGDPQAAAVIIGARNKTVEEAFDKSASGDAPPKSVAIFYGALHQNDLESVFVKKYGYKDVEQRWFTVAHADKHKIDAQGQQVLDLLEKQWDAMTAKPKKS